LALRTVNTGSVKLTLLAALAVIAIAISYVSRSGPAHDPNIKVVEIRLDRSVEISPVLASGGQESFSAAMDRLRPYAAINGTYYDENMKPLGDILIDGKLVNRGSQRNAIAITRSGKVEFIQRGRGRFRWSGYRAGLAAGPRLVHKGRIALDPVADGFRPESSNIRAWRSGIGKTARGKLLFVTAKKSLTLKQFAKVMLDLGAVEAMNLDGGGACGLYHKGESLVVPTLPMTNLLVVYRKSRE
jgi:exopolysaccharide biosynthesis protein